MKQKVFCIGFQKTGTTSLADALRILGYRVTGPDGARDLEISETVEDIVEFRSKLFDAFQDNPWPLFYRKLDHMYPGSKFILTRRDADRWIQSVTNFFGDTYSPIMEWIYGVYPPQGNEDVYLETYKRHNAEVLSYFEGRDDLLVIDMETGVDWPLLCQFLDQGVPGQPFPNSNARGEGQAPWRRVFRHIGPKYVKARGGEVISRAVIRYKRSPHKNTKEPHKFF